MTSKYEHSAAAGRRLAEAREERGISQTQMAVSLEMSLSTYIRTEKGERPLDVFELQMLEDMGFDIDWLIKGRTTKFVRPCSRTLDHQPLDRELMARIMDGLVTLYREENQRLVPLDQGRVAAELYDELIGIADEAERRGALKYAIEAKRKELRRASLDPASSKLQA